MADHASFDQLDIRSSWVTIGIFDGIHRGHQQIISTLTQGAHQQGASAVVVTFDPHPAKLLAGITMPKLTTLAEKSAILRDLGVDEVVTLPFTRELAALNARVFLTDLRKAANFTHLLTGYDFALGKDRAGDNQSLSELAAEMGFSHQVFPAFELDGVTISSTLLRRSIEAGDVAFARTAMGRPFTVTGKVFHGDGRGRTINIPTANVEYPEGKVLPKNGVYATLVQVRSERYAAVTNFGLRPTFVENAPAPRLEPHILDFDQEIYDEEITVEFVEFIRPEQRFDGVESLIAQIHKDIAATRAMKLLGQ